MPIRTTEVFVSRLVRLPLIDAEGVPIGRVVDVVLTPAAPGRPPRVLGLVADLQRREIFVNMGRIEEIDPSGVRLHGATVDLRRFRKRPGELLARRDILDKAIGGEVVNDLAVRPDPDDPRSWVAVSASLSSSGLLRRRRAGRTVGWRDLAGLFDVGPLGRQVAPLRDLHPADLANRIVTMGPERRRQLAEALEDDRLADLLEELPEEEQVKLIEGLDLERAAHVLEEMDADDAADLLAEMPTADREDLLARMEPDDAADLRRLLSYGGDTAGGLMTSEPLILPPHATVAEALARMRDPDLPAALAACVFVAESPTTTPTGRFLGTAGFQRLLREPPSSEVGECLDTGPRPLSPDLTEADVARRLAAYDVVAVPVVDDAGRLLGAVTVDDVLDHVLPEGWRRQP